ncbi:MAG: tRNA (N(6)-L-threonylcarbamoyladenosine(37)-C(2))-methylthiotransferase MtaB [Treponema sp.]|jgi:threonylcarbamoyladenosine tRNA methylthiotransferase MtaB|nr:tRNA (N(6)-L-threonylcarbamoyladenosine(37)-C(2))-methylthiotransferase MtaB [Treponema sp.]
MPSAALYTLGCKLNQLESESIADAFRKEGFLVVPLGEDAPERPDILVINTCTVTSHSEQKARRAIRKALRDYPESALIVTGCYAQLEAEALEALEAWEESPAGKRLFVIPGENKDRILDLPRFLTGNMSLGIPVKDLVRDFAAPVPEGGCESAGSFRFSPADFSFHSRAFLKIQDGCDNRCAYCRVSIARGKSRSLGAKEVLAGLKALEEKGYGEAVLTGVNISQYRDPQKRDLGGLLEYLLNETASIRLRLSSIEPGIFDPLFIRAVSHERVQPHFHLSLQSGSASVLARMGRSYTPAEAGEGISLLRAAKNDPFLACDIIAGFPGESQEEFEKTFEFCRETGFAWIHAFPFSRRPGTAAWNFTDLVNEKEAGLRVERLGGLALEGRKRYVRRWLGKETEVIPEADQGKSPGFAAGVSANYLKILIRLKGMPRPEAGKILRCRISGEPAREARFDAEGEMIL